MCFAAISKGALTRPIFNTALLLKFYRYEIYSYIIRVLIFFDGVLCKSCIYKYYESIDRKNIYTTFIKDCVLTEYTLKNIYFETRSAMNKDNISFFTSAIILS